jgi:glycosyltransferase involved in cell wall biosynthesis
MRVLAISSYGGLGGSELSLSAFLEHRPADVDARALLVSDGGLRARLAALGIPVAVASGYEGRPTARRLGRFTRSLLRLLSRDRPDVIWAMGQKGALLAAPAAHRARLPLVWHKVDFSWDRTLAVPVAAVSDGVVAVSEAAAEALGPLRPARLLGVVWPPVTLDPALAARPDPARPAIGTLARLVPYKGHHHILAAAALLLPEFPGLRVVLAGPAAREYPDYPRELERRAAQLGLAERVELPGFASAPEVLERLSVFVNATYRDEQGFGLEGLSGAMLEASWVGVPVVATRGGGTAEGVLDGETGTLVEPASPTALAAAIAPYLRDPELAARTGAAGRRFARERFAPAAASRRLFELIGSVVQRSSGCGTTRM